jgi:transmembrane sensor
MDQQRFWQLVSLKLSGEATSEEMRELEQFVQHNPEAGFKLDLISGIWNENDQPAQAPLSFKNHLQRLKNSELANEYAIPAGEQMPVIADPEKRHRMVSYLMVAASVVALTICGIHVYKETATSKNEAKKGTNIVATQKGSRTTVQLPDGTKVWLNADSKIYYDEGFKKESREVRLEGEAFFDVKKDSSRPFVIRTSVVDIKVLGTRFNVKSYHDEDETETALVTGSIEIRIRNNPAKKIVLHPNEKLVVKHALNRDSAVKQKDTGNTVMLIQAMRKDAVYKSSPETLWMENKLVFDGETLEEVCKKLERWYNVVIRIQDESLKKEIYTAIFDGETLLNVLTALKISARIDFSIHNKEVLIFRKNNSSL